MMHLIDRINENGGRRNVKKFVGERNSYKTSALIAHAYAFGCDILAASAAIADCILDTAVHMKLPGEVKRRGATGIPARIGEIQILIPMDLRCHDGISFKRPILIDDIDMVLPKLYTGVRIEGFSLTYPDPEMNQFTEEGRPMVSFDICKGNPGALAFLMDAYNKYIFRAEQAFQRMQDNGIAGDRLYMFWNDCCDRDTGKAINLMIEWPIEKIVRHINYDGGRGIPAFDETRETHG